VRELANPMAQKCPYSIVQLVAVNQDCDITQYVKTNLSRQLLDLGVKSV